MPSPLPRRRRLLVPTVLAAILAAEITGLAIARSIVSPATAPAAEDAGAAVSDTRADGPLARQDPRADASDAARDVVNALIAGRRSAPTPANLRPPAPSLTEPARAATARGSGSAPSGTRTTAHVAKASYHGRNHMWMPSLGITAGVQWFPCSRSTAPGPGVYRWGCAGRNNVYLMAHAWSTFRPLHDAYLRGRLHTGLKVWYADGDGRVHVYSVVWWRLTAPTTAASWAWAAQSRPSMTLQTCVGANSQYRLMVRLVQVG
jgi:hypothetical protein